MHLTDNRFVLNELEQLIPINHSTLGRRHILANNIRVSVSHRRITIIMLLIINNVTDTAHKALATAIEEVF